VKIKRYDVVNNVPMERLTGGDWVRYFDIAPLLAERVLLLALLEAVRRLQNVRLNWHPVGDDMRSPDTLESALDACAGIEREPGLDGE
jgi:hypothetical protein